MKFNTLVAKLPPRVQCFFGRHGDMKVIRNFYGDEINQYDGRSFWRCGICGHREFRSKLFEK